MTTTREELQKLGIGKKIRALRVEKGLSIKDLAEKSGVQEVLLSQIEGEVVAPTVAGILNISKVLEVSLDYFFVKNLSHQEIEVVRKADRRVVHGPKPKAQEPLTYSYESLAYHLADKHMEPFLVDFEFEEKGKEPIALSHPGEEFLFLLKGELEFKSGKKTVVLKEGDAMYFFSHQPHSLQARGKVKPKALVVLYPF